jgi:hypothetical protein
MAPISLVILRVFLAGNVINTQVVDFNGFREGKALKWRVRRSRLSSSNIAST